MPIFRGLPDESADRHGNPGPLWKLMLDMGYGGFSNRRRGIFSLSARPLAGLLRRGFDVGEHALL